MFCSSGEFIDLSSSSDKALDIPRGKAMMKWDILRVLTVPDECATSSSENSLQMLNFSSESQHGELLLGSELRFKHFDMKSFGSNRSSLSTLVSKP